HFDLFGLRQVWMYFKKQPYVALEFTKPWPYRIVRHPLYVGWLTLSWASPDMTIAHLAFAVFTTVYILIAIRWEEKDLVDHHGEAYRKYQTEVPMLIPKTALAGELKQSATTS
ncbi:MAG: isoprenylcysteine carboxylmethyltransferase family protein, partial [Planctomycetota bacterium]